MNTRNTPAGTVHCIDTHRARRHARPAPLPGASLAGKLTEAALDAHIEEQRAAADDCMGVVLAQRARAEREALAIAAGVPGDMSRFTDSQLDELDAIAQAAEEGRNPFDKTAAAIAIAVIAATLGLLWFVR